MTRTARIERQTKESKVLVELDLDGSGRANVSTGVGFYDHMLDSFARHSLVDLTVQTEGDLHIDAHHTVEDTAIVLGDALREALGDKVRHPPVRRRHGAARRGARAGRRRRVRPPYCVHTGEPDGQAFVTIGGETGPGYAGSLTRHVFETIAFHARIALHVRVLAGRDPHHIVEAQFKAFARALRDAVAIDPRELGVPSTKGTLVVEPSRPRPRPSGHRPRLRVGEPPLCRARPGAGRGRVDPVRRLAVTPRTPTGWWCPASAPSPPAWPVSRRCTVPRSSTAAWQAGARSSASASACRSSSTAAWSTA